MLQRLPLALLTVALLAAVPARAQQAPQESPPVVAPSDDPDAAENAPSKVPLEEIRRYVAVFNAVKEAYVEPVEDKQLMQSAIRGLLLDLDPPRTCPDPAVSSVLDHPDNRL